MARIPLAILLLAVLATLASASVPSFCKCTCFQNSTIIPLGPQHDNNNQPPPPPPKKPSPSSSSIPPSSSSSSTNNPPNTNPDVKAPQHQPTTPSPTTHARTHPLHPLLPRESSTSCKQCNRAFCLKYNLPICKDAEEKDIKTSCFQRDSPKDRFIVWGFLLGTAGLLGWAAMRRVVDSARERRQRRRQQQQGGVGGGGGSGIGSGMGMGGGVFGRFEGLIGGGNGGAGDNGQGFRTAPGGRVDRGVYDPLEDGHDEGVTRGPG